MCRSPQNLLPHFKVPRAPLAAAHAQLLAALGAGPPLPVPIWPLTRDLDDRRDHLRGLLNAMYAYLRAVLGDVAQNVPRDLDLRQIEALYYDLTSEVVGTLNVAAAALPGRRS